MKVNASKRKREIASSFLCELQIYDFILIFIDRSDDW